MKDKHLSWKEKEQIRHFRWICDRTGNYYKADFRDRSNVTTEIGFEMFKSWLGIKKGPVIFANVKIFYGWNCIEIKEIGDEDRLRLLSFMSEVLRNRSIENHIRTYNELIDVMLLLKEEYSEETSREAKRSFYSYCIENSEFILNEECKFTFLECSELEDEVSRYIDLVSYFHLNDKFIETPWNRVGLFEKCVIASLLKDEMLLSFKNGKTEAELCCSYEKNKTEYVAKYVYSYEHLYMVFTIEYQGRFLKFDNRLSGKTSSIIRNGENYNGLTTGSKIQDKKFLWVLKKLNNMIEEKFFEC